MTTPPVKSLTPVGYAVGAGKLDDIWLSLGLWASVIASVETECNDQRMKSLRMLGRHEKRCRTWRVCAGHRRFITVVERTYQSVRGLQRGVYEVVGRCRYVTEDASRRG